MIIEPQQHTVGPFQFQTFLKYYPKRFKVGFEYIMNRVVVYSFKDGINGSDVLKLFTDHIDSIIKARPDGNWWVCGIPTSKVLKHHKRYTALCRHIAKSCGINDGIDLLTPKSDRNAVHEGGERDYSQIISSINFGDVAGKDLILCDDVATMGKSFRILALHLISLKANSVRGVMLGKTHWDAPEESWATTDIPAFL